MKQTNKQFDLENWN